MSTHLWSPKAISRHHTFSGLVLAVVLLALSCSVSAQEAGGSEAEKEALLEVSAV